jgi:hypothetical protein
LPSLISVSTCSGGSTPPASNEPPCPLPWIRPTTRYFFDAASGQCVGFPYNGCGVGGDTGDFFASYEECANSCVAQSAGQNEHYV